MDQNTAGREKRRQGGAAPRTAAPPAGWTITARNAGRRRAANTNKY